MKRNRFYIGVVFLFLTFCQQAVAQQVTISNNLLYDAWLTPNLRVGLRLAPHWSMGVTGGYRPWPSDDNTSRKWRHLLISPDVRYWTESALMVGSPTVNIDVVNGRYYNDENNVIDDNAETPNHYPIPSHAQGKIGAINNVFGGGNAAKVIGNTNVNIATQSEVYVVKTVTVGSPVTDYFIRNFDGTYSAATGTAVEGTTYYEKKDVIGADIRGNVYGGGNNAEVTGNTNVQIGKKATE